MKLIVGLGNPGEEYKDTRHNLGFMIVEKLLPHVVFRSDQLSNSQIAKGSIQYNDIVLVKPQTFMNNSGIAVRKLIERYKLSLKDDLVVVHDDLSLDLGQIKISQGSGAGNHNGVQSIIDHLQTKDFIRVRCGIGRGDGIISDVVLSKFKSDENKVVDEMIQKAIEACTSIVADGIERAMNKFN